MRAGFRAAMRASIARLAAVTAVRPSPRPLLLLDLQFAASFQLFVGRGRRHFLNGLRFVASWPMQTMLAIEVDR